MQPNLLYLSVFAPPAVFRPPAGVVPRPQTVLTSTSSRLHRRPKRAREVGAAFRTHLCATLTSRRRQILLLVHVACSGFHLPLT